MPLAAREWLDREFMRMMQQGQRQRMQAPRYSYRQFFPAKAAAEAPKQMNGVRMNSNGSVTINGTTYSRDQFRAKLQEIVETMQRDSNSAYRDRRNPLHQQTVAEISLAYKFLNNELSPQDETAIVGEWHAATQEQGEVSNDQPYQQIAQMMRDPEVRIAKQRRDARAPLDGRQKAIMARHDALEAANNTIARKEAARAGGWMSTKPPHRIPSDLYALDRIRDPREKLHGVRELRAKIRGDKEHPYNNSGHADYKIAVETMRRLYEVESELPQQPEDETD
jgi:hypothetical protein